MRLKNLIFFVCFLHFPFAHAQMGKLFNTDNQLSSNLATQVFQDHDGFIWVATRNGLNRFDGYQFRTFKKEDANTGFNSNYINCITQSSGGTIFIGTNYTIQTYDGAHFHDINLVDNDGKPFRTYIHHIMQSSDGQMLACTSGYGIIRFDEASATGVTDTLLSAGNNYVRFLLEDATGRFWIATESDGLVLLEGTKRTSFFTGNDTREFIGEIRQDYKGNIYVAIRGKGIYYFDEASRSFHFIDQTQGLEATTLCISSNGSLLIGCDGQGIMRYDPQNSNLEDNPFYCRDINLSKGKAGSILEDINGNIWVCLLQKGVFMQPKARMDFGYQGYRLGDSNIIGTNCVTSTLIDSRGNVWVGTDKDGLYQVDKSQTSARHFTNCPSTILSMAEDTQGNIWLGSYGEGCGWLDTRNGQWHTADIGLGTAPKVFGIAAAKNGDVWLATMGSGLVRYNVMSHQHTHYQMADGADVDSTVNSIPNNYLTKIFLSPDQHRLFVATSVGLCCLDIEHDSWTSVFGVNCPNHGTFSRAVFADQRERVWLGSSDGLYRYDIQTRQSRYYTTRDGLPANGIASIIADRQGNLWLGTDHGLCCFNPDKNTCYNYYLDDGLQDNEFSDGAVSISAGGALLFGGTGGVSWFNPSDVKQQEWAPKVYLTGLILRNAPVTPGFKSGFYTVTDSTVIASRRFDLSPSDNTFTLQFSTFTYDSPEHITYAYRINGKQWTRLQTGTNDITFSGMSPGTYRFQVKAIHGQQETEIREFTIRIHSPWYASTWAWLAYLLLAATAVWLLLRNRRRKERDRLQLQEHIHAEQMADAKLRFFMNISHELRTPMTLVLTPLLSLIKQDDDPSRRSIYQTMRRNAERILGLINQMMDLRKIDKGLMKMRMRETDLISFVGDIYTLFDHQAKTKNIRFTYLHDADQLPVWIDRGNFDKVIVNILSNAFKFTPPGGDINIRVTHTDSQATIAVRDNGEGIPDEVMSHIFERFYQRPSSANDSNVGTGIGLDLTRSLVELHHGTIEAHNNGEAAGCEFVVAIPLGNAHLQPDEIDTTPEEDTALAIPDDSESAEEATALPKVGRRYRIVIVEDDYEIREALSAELSSDYDVTGCTNGMEGLKECLRSLPDLVISDIMMPEMDGNTLCTKLKTSPTTNHIPVILLTAKSRDEDQLEGLETGADAYIVKPFNMDILRRTIVNLLRRNEQLRLKYGRNDQLEERVDEVEMKSPDEKLLERIMFVINRDLSNDGLSVDRIAGEVGISRVHLHRKMKELTGQTPHDFIRGLRLKRAAHLLANNGMNVAEVMYACGFNNSASFSTVFKRFYGLSPRDYMREHQKKGQTKE